MGIWCQNDVVLTSMRRDDVALTFIRRHFSTKCPPGRDWFPEAKIFSIVNEFHCTQPFIITFTSSWCEWNTIEKDLKSLVIRHSYPYCLLGLICLSWVNRGGRVVRWCWVNFQSLGVLLLWIRVGQGPTALAVDAGGGCLDIFSLVYHFSFLFPSLWETARYRLKYCLKGPLSPKQTTAGLTVGCIYHLSPPQL